MTTKIFVFGSNLAGKHKKGSALKAYEHHGAILGRAKGIQGLSYAIPTRDHGMSTLGLKDINGFVQEFLVYAREHPQWEFDVVNIGCGNAGYKPEDIAPMFRDRPPNVILREEFLEVLR